MPEKLGGGLLAGICFSLTDCIRRTLPNGITLIRPGRLAYSLETPRLPGVILQSVNNLLAGGLFTTPQPVLLLTGLQD